VIKDVLLQFLLLEMRVQQPKRHHFYDNNRPISLLLGHAHRSITYVDAAYCYRPSSVVCQSVGLSVTVVSPAKTAAPIEMPFGLRTRVGPDRPMGTGNFERERGVPL